MPQDLLTAPTLVVGAAVLLGLIIGSFLNVVIYRLPLVLERDWKNQSRDFLGMEPEPNNHHISLAFPASHCPSCGVAIKPWHNIPVLSYLLLRGRCGSCSTKISVQYPLVELICGLITGVVVLHFGFTEKALFVALFSWALICLTGIDFGHKLLPDNITLPLLWLGLLVNLDGTFVPLGEAVIGAAAGYLSLWSVYWVFKWITGKEGMGHGDFKLLAALGAWMGWQFLPMIILLASLVGAIVGITLIATMGRDRQIPIAFGPYLAAAGWIALLWGQDIMNWYLP